MRRETASNSYHKGVNFSVESLALHQISYRRHREATSLPNFQSRDHREVLRNAKTRQDEDGLIFARGAIRHGGCGGQTVGAVFRGHTYPSLFCAVSLLILTFRIKLTIRQFGLHAWA